MATRFPWTLRPMLENAERLYSLPLFDLIFEAHRVHREHHDAQDIQRCTLLSIKTGGCPEDCAYCPQSAHYDTGLAKQALVPLDAVREAARNARLNGAQRFCMGAAWRDGPFWSVLMGVAAEVSILLPSTLLMVLACLSWNRLRNSPWRQAFEKALGPITLGILFAVGVKIIKVSDTDLAGLIASLVVCVLMLRTRLSPLLFMAVCGVLGAIGLLNATPHS